MQDCITGGANNDKPQKVATTQLFSPDSSKVQRASHYLDLAMRELWGDLLDTEGMQETPKRVARHWQAITTGLNQDPLTPLAKVFSCDHDEIVLVKDIPVVSLCEHHLLPVFGVAHAAYIPSGKVVGLSKIPRTIKILSKRPQLQERLNDEIAAALQEALNPQGVAVVIKARHACMEYRGVMAHGAETVTSSLKGAFREDPAARVEVLRLLGL